MLNFLSEIKKTVQNRLSLVFTPPTDSMSSSDVRQRALLLGLPALLVAAIGVGALSWAKFGMANGLEEQYQKKALASGRQKIKLTEELTAELRVKQGARVQPSGDQSIDSLIPKDDPRRVELKRLQSSERVYWEKLISLNPKELDYRYQLALAIQRGGDAHRGLALMQAIAPLTKPGYSKAHLWLARYLLGVRSNNEPERKKILNMAYQHAELCLRRGGQADSVEGRKERETAQFIKATLLRQKDRLIDAYEAYEELFENRPEVYERLIEINNKLHRENRNHNVLSQALGHFESKISDPELDIEHWVDGWGHVVKCWAGQKRFELAEEKLLEEIKVQASAGTGGVVKRVFVGQLLGKLYLAWMKEAVGENASSSPEGLGFLKKAYRYSPNDVNVLSGLARIAVCDDADLANAAKEIYDPENHPDPPAAVLNELGSNALSRGNHEAAIRYFELAVKKSPRKAAILNNLAYTYLVCQDKDPARSLKLVDEAIRFFPKNDRSKMVLSHFFDTRGNALMQLSRMTEAIAAFEIAIRERPENRAILEALVKCYGEDDLAQVYQKRLTQLETRESAGGASKSPASGNTPGN